MVAWTQWRPLPDYCEKASIGCGYISILLLLLGYVHLQWFNLAYVQEDESCLADDAVAVPSLSEEE